MTPEEFVFWMDGLLEGRVTISEECLKMIRAANREALDHIKLSRAPSLKPASKEGCGGPAQSPSPEVYGWTRPKDWEGPNSYWEGPSSSRAYEALKAARETAAKNTRATMEWISRPSDQDRSKG